MAEIKISELDLISSADGQDLIEIVDVDDTTDGPDGTSKAVSIENLGITGIKFFDQAATFNSGDKVLRSSDAADDGEYDNSFDDYRLYICQQDSTSGTWGAVSSNFQEVVFVISDDSLSGSGYDGDPLSVDIDNVNYPTGGSTTQDGQTISTATEALDFLLDRSDFYIVANDTERGNLATTEGRLIYHTGDSTFQKYEDGSWKDVTIFTDTELTTFLNNTSVTTLSDVNDAGSGSIITTSERNRLIPNVIDVNSSNKSQYLTDNTGNTEPHWLFNFSSGSHNKDNLLGSIIRFNQNSLGLSDPIRIELPVTDTNYDVGWHMYFIVIEGSTNVEIKLESGTNLEPFSEIDCIAGFLSSVYNIKTNSGQNNYWVAIGNILDAT